MLKPFRAWESEIADSTAGERGKAGLGLDVKIAEFLAEKVDKADRQRFAPPAAVDHYGASPTSGDELRSRTDE